MVPIFVVVLVLAVVGVLLWLFNVKVTTMDPTIKTIINIIVVVAVVVYVLKATGLWKYLMQV